MPATPPATAHIGAQLTRSGIASIAAVASLGPDTAVPLLTLRLPFFDATASVCAADDGAQVWFEGELPTGVGRATFTHQGALSLIGQLREQQLGIDVVDAAFLIFCDDDGFALLTRCRDPLAALVPTGVCARSAQIHLESDMLRLLWPFDELAALPALWERMVSIRTGA